MARMPPVFVPDLPVLVCPARCYTIHMQPDRRRFLASALSAAPLFVPRRVWGANDRVSYGLIGAGGRGRYLNQNFQKLGAECAAVAEVYQPHLDTALKTAPNAKSYLDYHDSWPSPDWTPW
jgi:hypothetical protein